MPKSVLRAVLGRMQFILHATRRTPHGASRLVQAMSAWLVKTRRAPSRHGRDARVYGHKTTAMHKLSTPPPPQLIVRNRKHHHIFVGDTKTKYWYVSIVNFQHQKGTPAFFVILSWQGNALYSRLDGGLWDVDENWCRRDLVTGERYQPYQQSHDLD